jgi:hypothetical protein
MTFLTGITNLTNWLGNVIMPTLAGLFFAFAVLRYARGYPNQCIAWAEPMCLMVSGLPVAVWYDLRDDVWIPRTRSRTTVCSIPAARRNRRWLPCAA